MCVPPQNLTIDTSPPIAHRLRHPKKDADFNMPMVEVSGPEGATLVFRPWTSTDVTTEQPHHRDEGRRRDGESNRRRKTNDACFRCGRHGHRNRDCPNVECFNCGRFGHRKLNCPTLTSSNPANTSD